MSITADAGNATLRSGQFTSVRRPGRRADVPVSHESPVYAAAGMPARHVPRPLVSRIPGMTPMPSSRPSPRSCSTSPPADPNAPKSRSPRDRASAGTSRDARAGQTASTTRKPAADGDDLARPASTSTPCRRSTRWDSRPGPEHHSALVQSSTWIHRLRSTCRTQTQNALRPESIGFMPAPSSSSATAEPYSFVRSWPGHDERPDGRRPSPHRRDELGPADLHGRVRDHGRERRRRDT